MALSTGLMTASLFIELKLSPGSTPNPASDTIPKPPTEIYILSVKTTTFILGAMQGCILGISGERIYATIKYKTYEISKNFCIPIAILGCSLAYAVPNYIVWTEVALGNMNFFVVGAFNFLIQFLCAGVSYL